MNQEAVVVRERWCAPSGATVATVDRLTQGFLRVYLPCDAGIGAQQ